VQLSNVTIVVFPKTNYKGQQIMAMANSYV